MKDDSGYEDNPFSAEPQFIFEPKFIVNYKKVAEKYRNSTSRTPRQPEPEGRHVEVELTDGVAKSKASNNASSL